MSRSKLRNEPRASFEFEVTEDKIVQIIDQDNGRSVTNDIENVLADIAEAEGVATLAGYQVIYRDTEKDWCRVQLDATGRFQGYAYFGTDQAAALARLRALATAAE